MDVHQHNTAVKKATSASALAVTSQVLHMYL